MIDKRSVCPHRLGCLHGAEERVSIILNCFFLLGALPNTKGFGKEK